MVRVPAIVAFPSTSTEEKVEGLISISVVLSELSMRLPVKVSVPTELPGFRVAPFAMVVAPSEPVPFKVAPDWIVTSEADEIVLST